MWKFSIPSGADNSDRNLIDLGWDDLIRATAAPEGIENFHNHHPDIPIVTAAIDESLDERGYIVPGLGDAGDRMYGTK